MNNRAIIMLPLLMLIFTSALMSSCGQDRWAEYHPYTVKAEWIDSVMRADYYWASEMSSSSRLNYFSTPSTFLSAVKYSADHVSHVDSTYTVSDSYGITATFYSSPANDTIYNALVTYVATNSSA